MDHGTRSSYWERFRKRSEAPEKTALQIPSTLFGDYSDNINYFGELTAGSRDSPQQATGHQQCLDEHVDSSAPIELRNNQTPRKKSYRKGREKQKAKRLARLNNAPNQLRQSDYDTGLSRRSPYAPEGPESLEMPTYWATATGDWGNSPTIQRQSAHGFDDFNLDHGHHGEPAYGRGRGSPGHSRRGSLIDGRADYVQDGSYGHGPRMPSHSSYGGPDAEQSRRNSLSEGRADFVRNPSYDLGTRRPSYPSHIGPNTGQSRRSGLIDGHGDFVQDASYDHGPRRPSHSSYGGLNAGYTPHYGPYSPPDQYSERRRPQRPDSPFREHGIEQAYGRRPGSVTDSRDGFVREPSLDYDSRRPSTSFHDDDTTEHQAYQDAYYTPRRLSRDSHDSRRDEKREAMPYASRLSKFRKQQQRTTTNREKIKQSKPYSRHEQAVQRHGATHGGITKRTASREPAQNSTDFVHPDRAWLRSPDEGRMQQDGGRPPSHSESFPIETKEVNTHTRQSHGRPTPGRTPEGQTRLVSPSLRQDYGTRPIQAPQSRGASKGLSAEDGHQWAQGRAAGQLRRGGRRGGKERHLKRNYQGGGPGRRGRSPASERP